MNEKITINGTDYEVISSSEFEDIFQGFETLKPKQAFRYYDKWVYRVEDGKFRACYANDTSNNWSI